MGACPQHPKTSAQFFSPYGPPTPPAPAIVTVTTRNVPVLCGVCKGYGNRPELPDEPDTEWIKCQPCDGKGWLFVTETTTTRTG